MDYAMISGASLAPRLPMKPTRGSVGREAANGSFVDVPRALLAAGILVLMVASSANAGYARDRLPGDVGRLAMTPDGMAEPLPADGHPIVRAGFEDAGGYPR